MKKTHFDSKFFEQENDQFSFGDLGNNFPLFFSDKKKKHKHKKHKKDKRERKALKKRLKALELQDEKIVGIIDELRSKQPRKVIPTSDIEVPNDVLTLLLNHGFDLKTIKQAFNGRTAE